MASADDTSMAVTGLKEEPPSIANTTTATKSSTTDRKGELCEGDGCRVPRVSRQFWQAGEFLPETGEGKVQRSEQPGLDHARLHPRFLHSNATSHKWALGALVELLDNSMDEVGAGCTYVIVDKVNHPMDGVKNPMLLVEDNGGGMDPSTIRNCMSFGFSLKHGKKMIGQYGNGFKTSTMRLGADAMVLTKSKKEQTSSVGLLSYTFLTETNSQDVAVPIVDYSLQERTRLTRGDESEWKSKLEMICGWGPFGSEAEIWRQFDTMPVQGTRVYIWNLWETSDNLPELDFLTDANDIRLRGHEEDVAEASGRKKKPDEGIRRCHSYRHSLRSYVSMLYLQWPENFQIVVRGEEVIPVPVTAGMKHVAVYDYRPRSLPKDEAGAPQGKGPVVVPVYVGFAVEAPDTSVSGFCVYHRNRLIKPFWKVYASASSVGRGVIGFLQVDFVEPAHDKQDFENTPPLQKLEKYLKRQVPQYWRTKSHLVGYQDHIAMNKSDPNAPLDDLQSAAKEDREMHASMPTQNSDGTEGDEAMQVDSVEVQNTPSKKQSSATGARHSTISSTGRKSSARSNDGGKGKTPLKTPFKCMHEMQQHISQLQHSVQEFCNTYEIKEDAQLVLGRIFGTTMYKVLDPARELKKMCAAQIKGHRQALLFIAKSKTEGKLTGTVPQFIQAEMKAMGLDLNDTTETPETPANEETNIAAQPVSLEVEVTTDVCDDRPVDTEGMLLEHVEDKDNRADTPDTDDGMSNEHQRKTEAGDMTPTEGQTMSVPMDVDLPECPAPASPTTASHPDVARTAGGQSQDLAQIGLSVVEKFLKTKPPKLGVVQLAPSSKETQKRGFASGGNEGPLEVVNLSEDVDSGVDPPPKRHKSTLESDNGIRTDEATEKQQPVSDAEAIQGE